MATIIADRLYTPEDLLKMPEGNRYELVNGRLVEDQLGALSCWVAIRVSMALGNFVVARSSGLVLSSEAQYRCFPGAPNRVRKPDVSFIRLERMTENLLHGFITIPPDLAVEVVSDNDTYSDVTTKVQEYLQAGVRLVWLFDPCTRTVRVYRGDRSVAELDAQAELSGEDVLPGFAVPVGSLFETPPLPSGA